VIVAEIGQPDPAQAGGRHTIPIPLNRGAA